MHSETFQVGAQALKKSSVFAQHLSACAAVTKMTITFITQLQIMHGLKRRKIDLTSYPMVWCMLAGNIIIHADNDCKTRWFSGPPCSSPMHLSSIKEEDIGSTTKLLRSGISSKLAFT